METVDATLRYLARRLNLAAFWRGLADALAAASLIAGLGLLAARLAGQRLEPSPWWLLGLAVPLAWGVACAARTRWLPRDLAAHLDRRLQLSGLLVSALEREPAEWSPQLAAGVARIKGALPRWSLLHLFDRVALPVAFLVAVLALPALSRPQPKGRDPALAQAIGDAAMRLGELGVQALLSPDVLRELTGTLARLEANLARDEKIAWSDVDNLLARLTQAAGGQATRLGQARGLLQAAAVAARGLADRSHDAGAGPALAQAARVAIKEAGELMREGGLAGQLPAGLLDRLARVAGSAGAELDADALRGLATEMAGILRVKGEALAALGATDPRLLADLARDFDPAALARLLAAGAPMHVHGPACAGGCEGAGSRPGLQGLSGIAEGGGPAPLAMINATRDGTAPPAAERLPPGVGVSRDFQRVAAELVAPEAAPERTTEPGREGDTGTGAAAWRRVLAPRHRDAVRRFFDGTDGGQAGTGR